MHVQCASPLRHSCNVYVIGEPHAHRPTDNELIDVQIFDCYPFSRTLQVSIVTQGCPPSTDSTYPPYSLSALTCADDELFDRQFLPYTSSTLSHSHFFRPGLYHDVDIWLLPLGYYDLATAKRVDGDGCWSHRCCRELSSPTVSQGCMRSLLKCRRLCVAESRLLGLLTVMLVISGARGEGSFIGLWKLLYLVVLLPLPRNQNLVLTKIPPV